MKQWLETQLQTEYKHKLVVEGAIAALEAALKELTDAFGRQPGADLQPPPVLQATAEPQTEPAGEDSPCDYASPADTD